MGGMPYSQAGWSLVNLSFATAGECPGQIEAGLSHAETADTQRNDNVARGSNRSTARANAARSAQSPSLRPLRSLREITRQPAEQTQHTSAK
jgi:hypothetical protein